MVGMAESSGEKASQPEFEIPKPPVAEDAQERLLERTNEQKQINENSTSKQAPKFQPPQQTPPPALATPSQVVDDNQIKPTSKSPSAGLQAHDADLIEKEWIDRAKAIVAQTKNDPYKQKSEMSKVKADYLKKRFDKTIPVDEHSKS